MTGRSSRATSGSRIHEYADEIEGAIRFEENEIKAGRIENAVLLEGIAGNINVAQFLKVARFRGKHWKFLSALSDKSLEIQGYAMLDFMADAVGRDLAKLTYQKARLNFAHLNQLKGEMDARYGADEFTEQIFSEMCDDLVDMARDTRHRYWQRINRLLG